MSLINDALKRASRPTGQSPLRSPATVPLQPVVTVRPHRSPAVYWIPLVAVLLLGGAAALFWMWQKGRTVEPPALPPAVVAAVPPVSPSPPAPAGVQHSSVVTAPVVAPTSPVPPPGPKAVPPPVKETRDLARLTNRLVTRVVTLEPPPASPPVELTTPSGVIPSPPVIVAPVETKVPMSSPPFSNPAPVAVVSIPPPSPPPPPPPKVEWPAITLQGIMYGEKPSAIINGRWVAVGDELGEMKVTAIERRSVKLQLRGEVKEVKLAQ